MELKKMYCKSGIIFFFLILFLLLQTKCGNKESNIVVKVGVASEEFTDADSIKQEGKLRATAMVIEGGGTKLCIVSCDVIQIRRSFIDDVGRKIETELGIPFGNILISATHTHQAPSIGEPFGIENTFVKRLKDAIFLAVSEADNKLKTARDARVYFWLGQESTVGQNSRLLLSDSTIFWYGRREDAIRPTGTFDPELPVIAFRSEDENLEAVLFNHSTHNITFPSIGFQKFGIRSPAFYGLAAQELEKELGGKFLFLLGAHGSIHDLTLTTEEKVLRIKEAVKEALLKAQKRKISRLVSVKEEFEYRVREFNEEEEEKAVSYYCRKRFGNISPGWNPDPEATIVSFRNWRHELAPYQGEVRKSWLQVMVIGDVAIVGVSGELFNDLGIDIKRRSPFRYTYVVSLANDQIGYIPDKKGFELGGYQLWSNWSSHVAKGTGEAIVDRASHLLSELYSEH
jgi:neutral ceramidase